MADRDSLANARAIVADLRRVLAATDEFGLTMAAIHVAAAIEALDHSTVSPTASAKRDRAD